MTVYPMKAIASIIICAISLLFISTDISAQTSDTLINGREVPSVAEDSINQANKINGEELINDTEQAKKLVSEYEAIGMLDSLSGIPYFRDYYFNTDSSVQKTYAFPAGYVPDYPDSVYAERIGKLNHETTIELAFNKTVKSYIDLYAVKKRELTSRILGLQEIYFPLFEEYLDKYDMPLELKYLAVVESALNPTAGSRAGAKGLWQFMYYTGKLYGLKVTTLVDDRYDPYLATDAACRHLKDLYNMFGDWSLAMAAYNSGAGNVSKAIRRAGGVRNYWAIWPFLPRETRGYVPAFIAVAYVMNFAPEHNLYPLHPGILYDGIDTVVVNQPLAFDQVSEYIGTPMRDLKFLNPIFKTNLIPAYDGKSYVLRLPKEYVLPFVDNEEAIYQYKSKSGLERDKILAEIKKASERSVHIVRSGENLGLIARRYHISVGQLKSWNNLRSNTIYPGQRLVVYPTSHIAQVTYSGSSSGTREKEQPSSKTTTTTSKKYHVVRSGENLGLISKKYGCSVSQLKSWNNLRGNTIYPKQKLVVGYEKVNITSSGSDLSGADTKIIYYTVKKGDTLWDIAQQYKGVTVNDLKKLNNLGNSSRLQPGQKLKIAIDG